MRHLIKAHSKPGGEQCLYCPFRYLDILTHIDNVHTKGQLISKGLFDVIVWTKKPTKFFKQFFKRSNQKMMVLSFLRNE